MNVDTLAHNFLPFMLRLILGIVLFFQAYDKIFNISLSEVGKEVLSNSKINKLPKQFVSVSIWVSSLIELVGGLLLIVGLFRSWAMIAIGINLIMVTLGFSFIKGIWDTQHVFFRLVLLSALFLIPMSTDVCSLDYLLRNFFPLD